MGLPGVIDSSVYEGLKDVLQRQPEVTAVEYEPDSISKKFLRATIDSTRVPMATGQKPPALDVEWRFDQGETYYRIHYHDPNSGFNCGWHRDGDHSDLGSVHFQYELPMGETNHERAQFAKTVPTEILWECVGRLFEEVIPHYTEEQPLERE